MQITQVAQLLNTVVQETLGDTVIVNEDLSNVVDVGQSIMGSDNVDKYVRKLINHIGKVIFVDRTYKGEAPSIMMDGWEYGSILEKIQMDLPDAVENDTWKLESGTTYNQDVFNAPKVDAKFFNRRLTFEIDMSLAEKQVKQSFSNAQQLNAFFSMIENRIKMRKTIDYDNLIMRTINNFNAANISSTFGRNNTVLNAASFPRARNLLFEYNSGKADTDKLTAKQALENLDFLKFATKQIKMYVKFMRKASNLFNIGGKSRFTPEDLQHVVFLNEFVSSAEMYLQADTFHDFYTELPKAETVSYWQGSGDDYDFDATSKINVTIANPLNVNGNDNKAVEATGIIGTIFDRDAMGVCNVEDRVPTHYNAKGEFINNFYKSDAQYFNDYNENCVTFLIA